MNDDFESELRAELRAAVADCTPSAGLRNKVHARRAAHQRRTFAGAAAATVLAGASITYAATEVGWSGRTTGWATSAGRCPADQAPSQGLSDPASVGGEVRGHTWRVDFASTVPMIDVRIDGEYAGGMSDGGDIGGEPRGGIGWDVGPGFVVVTAWLPAEVEAIELHLPAGATTILCPAASSPDPRAHWFGAAVDAAPAAADFLDANGTTITTSEFWTPDDLPAPASGVGYQVDIPFG